MNGSVPTRPGQNFVEFRYPPNFQIYVVPVHQNSFIHGLYHELSQPLPSAWHTPSFCLENSFGYQHERYLLREAFPGTCLQSCQNSSLSSLFVLLAFWNVSSQHLPEFIITLWVIVCSMSIRILTRKGAPRGQKFPELSTVAESSVR